MFEKTDTTKVWDKDAGVERIVKEGSINFDQFYELLIGCAFEKKGGAPPSGSGGGGGFSFPNFFGKK